MKISSPSKSWVFPLLFMIAAAATSEAGNLTAYDILQSYNFPVGILPVGVTQYEINPSTGKFSVYLNKTCDLSIQGYELKYRTKITGTISRDRIANLSGIQVKLLLFWFDIIRVSKDREEMNFSVGVISAGFPVDSFDASPQCGCGFHCANLKAGDENSDLTSLVPLFE